MLYSRPTWRRSRRVRTDSHSSFPSYLTVNVYACSSPTPALAKIWTLYMETSTGGTQIARFVKFKDANLSFRRLISPRFRQIRPSWYIQEHKTHSNRIQTHISDSFGSFGYAAVPSHPANCVSLNQPNYEPYPSLTHSSTPPTSAVTLLVSPSFPFRLIWPTSMIDRLRIPCMLSRDGFFWL